MSGGGMASYYSVEPAVPDPATAAALRAEFGPRLSYFEQGWLLWVAAASDAAAPVGFLDAPGDGFVLAGPADLVVCEGGDRIRIETTAFRPTLRVVAEAVIVFADRPGLVRYLTLVADRFDQDGRRVERVVGQRCTLQPIDVSGEWDSVEAEAREERQWWSS